jgi:hypothetical protein
MEETVDVSESAAILTPGDIVVLYTDGVTEGRHDGAFFGEAGIVEVLDASAELTAQAVADAVVAAASASRTARPVMTSRLSSSRYRSPAPAEIYGSGPDGPISGAVTSVRSKPGTSSRATI